MVVSPNYPDYGYHPSNFMYSIVEWMGDDIDIKELKNHQWVEGMEGYKQANYNYAWYNNPYFALMQAKHADRRNITTGQLRLNYQVLPELSVMGRVSLRSQRNLTENLKYIGSVNPCGVQKIVGDRAHLLYQHEHRKGAEDGR